MARQFRRRIHIGTGSVFFDVIPLLALPMIFYNFVVFAGIAGSTPAEIAAWMIAPALTVPMFSGAVLNLSMSDIILFLSMWLLFFEIIKSARTDALSVMNHSISTITLLVATVEFRRGAGILDRGVLSPRGDAARRRDRRLHRHDRRATRGIRNVVS